VPVIAHTLYDWFALTYLIKDGDVIASG
jgi:hypothetical protein